MTRGHLVQLLAKVHHMRKSKLLPDDVSDLLSYASPAWELSKLPRRDRLDMDV